MIYLLLVFIFNTQIYAQTAQEEFDSLRLRHIGQKVSTVFTADFSEQSANVIINRRVPKPYRVEIEYNVRRGIDLWVRDTEIFYEQILQSYAQSVNIMLLPILSTPTYDRIKQNMIVTKVKPDLFDIRFKKGDIEVRYLLQIGDFDLVKNIAYWEDDKRQFVLDIKWDKFKETYVPKTIKGISYIQSHKAATFTLVNYR